MVAFGLPFLLYKGGMRMQTFKKNVFTEYRLWIVEPATNPLTNDNLVKAMTLNENLKSLGFTLSAEDVVFLARSNSLDTAFDDFQSLLDTVDAKPMYPNFPKQVMKMDEAEYRFHQLLHYFSTYGVEKLFLEPGEQVHKGWLPDVKNTEKTKEDTTLLEAKVIELLSTEDMYSVPLTKIVSKRERMTLPEKEIIAEICRKMPVEIMVSVLEEHPVAFKQNLMMVFNQILDYPEEKKTVPMLHAICQHTGDVMKCMDYALTHHRYHFPRALKRTLVRLLESYPVADFKANLILSQKKGRRNVFVLNYIDYNTFTKSEPHKKAVAELRNGDLRSWESQMKYLLSNDKDHALDFIAQRPGMMLRMVAWLIRLGYDANKISEIMCEKCSSLSVQTLTSVLTHFSKKDDEESVLGFNVLLPVLKARLEKLDTPLKGKCVYIDEGMFDLAESTFGKSEEGGYLRQGLAIRIPENVNRLRFFVYWNDKRRVDIDLHAYYRTIDKQIRHVGWCSEFDAHGIVTSGDITHSDAAEYIDIDLTKEKVEKVVSSIQVFTGERFKDIETCYVGMMAVDEIGKKVKLYNPRNCFFTHNLRGNTKSLGYGEIDVEKRLLRLSLAEHRNNYDWDDVLADSKLGFTIKEYVQYLLEAQGATVTEDKEKADVVLSVDKQENSVSLLDENFFMEK